MKVFLNDKEKLVIKLLALGYDPKQAAPKSGLTYNTFKNYLRIVKAKLNAKTTNNAIAIAVANGLVIFSTKELPEVEPLM